MIQLLDRPMHVPLTAASSRAWRAISKLADTKANKKARKRTARVDPAYGATNQPRAVLEKLPDSRKTKMPASRSKAAIVDADGGRSVEMNVENPEPMMKSPLARPGTDPMVGPGTPKAIVAVQKITDPTATGFKIPAGFITNS